MPQLLVSRWSDWRWQPVLEKWGHLRVLIDPKHLKTASFVVEKGEPVGTVFFVSGLLMADGSIHPDWKGTKGTPVGTIDYAVTARHVVQDEHGDSKDVAIRLNLKHGGLRDEPISPHAWVHSKSPEVDISILPVTFLSDEHDVVQADYRSIARHKEHIFDSGEQGLRGRYGAGNEVFTIGLYVGYSGMTAAQPVVRFGHIALYPVTGERILAQLHPPSDELTAIEAFLTEITTWHGQSGSPLYIRPFENEERSFGSPLHDLSFLVGMIQGFHPGELESMTFDGKSYKLPANLGIAIVIPSTQIVELIEGDDRLVKQRKEAVKRMQTGKIKPVAASVLGKKEKEEFTRQNFQDSLRRVSRKVPESEAKEK